MLSCRAIPAHCVAWCPTARFHSGCAWGHSHQPSSSKRKSGVPMRKFHATPIPLLVRSPYNARCGSCGGPRLRISTQGNQPLIDGGCGAMLQISTTGRPGLWFEFMKQKIDLLRDRMRGEGFVVVLWFRFCSDKAVTRNKHRHGYLQRAEKFPTCVLECHGLARTNRGSEDLPRPKRFTCASVVSRRPPQGPQAPRVRGVAKIPHTYAVSTSFTRPRLSAAEVLVPTITCSWPNSRPSPNHHP